MAYARGPGVEAQKYIEKYPDIFFQTTWLICLKFGIQHCLVVLIRFVQMKVSGSKLALSQGRGPGRV